MPAFGSAGYFVSAASDARFVLGAEVAAAVIAPPEDRCFERGDSVADALVAILRSAVSGENIDFLLRWFGALDTCDGEALIALCDPSGVFISSLAVVDGGAYHGHDRMRRYLGDLEEALGDGYADRTRP